MYPEESRNDLPKGSTKKRTSSNDSSPSSSFENKIGKKYNPQSEFKVHFYVRHVHMNGMNENEFLSFIKRKGKKCMVIFQLIWLDHVKWCKCSINKGRFVMWLLE